MNNQGQDHFFWIDLVNRAQPFDEMRRRIDMRSPLLATVCFVRGAGAAQCY
jgi:hypothetical protein